MSAARRAVPRAAQPSTWSRVAANTRHPLPRGGGWGAGGLAAAVLTGLILLTEPALALEYRSVAEAGTVMFDAPSQKAKPVFLIARGTPVEVVVNLEGWVKVRDAAGDIAWVERKSLAETRMLIVTAKSAEVRSLADNGAPLVFEADKDVLLELIEPGPLGWAKVRHRDGQSGFVRASQVWGL